jgi:hypothetical protein
MDLEVMLEYAKLLREHFGAADVEEVRILGDVDEMSEDELLVFGALMLSGFYDQTLEELISDIAADRGNATVQ